MALAVDATSTKNTGASPASSPSWSHTCTGSELALYIGVGWSTASRSVSSVTYNGISLTQVGSTVTNGNANVAFYRLIAPTTGANTAQVNFSGGTVSAWMWAISFTGADQTNPDDANNSATGSTSPIATSVTPVADSDYIIDMAAFLSNVSVVVDASQTQVLNANNASNATRGVGSYHTGAVSPAASTTMQWTFTGTVSWAQLAVAVRAAYREDNKSFTTNTTNQTAGGTTTFSYTVGSGSNRLLLVTISQWNNSGGGSGMTSVTYGGSSMTLVPSTPATNGDFYTEMWRLVAPPTGANNLVVTVSAKTDKLGIGIVSFTGADQTTGIDTATSATGTAASVTASLTTAAANEYLVDCVCHLSANNPSSHSDVQIYSDAASGVSTDAQYKLASSSGSNSMSWTFPDPGDSWTYSVAAVKSALGSTLTVANDVSLWAHPTNQPFTLKPVIVDC